MRKVIESYKLELIYIFSLLFVGKIILFGYNLIGKYEFNNLFLGR